MATKNEFASNLYSSTGSMVDAIACHWLTSDGSNGEAIIAEILREDTDEKLADECIEGWGLDDPGETYDPYDDDGPQSHMEFNGYNRSDLVEAFAALRRMYSDIVICRCADAVIVA